ncbi:aryl-sulfate sulfotransferase [candidate division KSB1 bacterium]|nr:aryl-sulfate sulfotransferase [candidate division KSB1 bacterium]
MNRRIFCYSAMVFFAVMAAANASPMAGYDYLSPRPNATYVAPSSTIIIRLSDVSPQQVTNLHSFIRITNSKNEVYTGVTKIASDQKTIIFRPVTEFEPLETVHVRLAPMTAEGMVPEVQYSFSVSAICEQSTFKEDVDPFQIQNATEPSITGAAEIMPNGVSVPSDFPHMNVLVHKNPSSDYIFLNNWGEQPYNIIFDTEGNPVWYGRFNDRRRDFKVQKNGVITMLKRDGGEHFIGFDKNFTKEIAAYHASGGYGTDEHELQVLENGNYLLIGIRSLFVDMSKYVEGGNTNCEVRESSVQEFTPEGDLILLWRAWDNFSVLDMVTTEDKITNTTFRFPHMNSIDIDYDGNIILSSRFISEVTKIDRQTGDMIWRLGGKNNQFTFVNDPLNGIDSQHDARVVGPNHYTVFDNGNAHSPSESRVPEYELDLDKMTATMIWEYRHTPKRYSYWMGNAQRLPNGNQHINWADTPLPKVTEVTPDGEVVLEMQFEKGLLCYRSWRGKWDEMVEVPYLVMEAEPSIVTLIYNKFGDPNVDFYNIYAGTTRNPTELFATSQKTLIHLTEFPDEQIRYYFRVTAVDKNGVESGYSNETSTVLHRILRGNNILANGMFSKDTLAWVLQVSPDAEAEWRVEDGTAYIDIANGGDDISDVQLIQKGIFLENRAEYLLKYDAGADANREIEPEIIKDSEPWTNYSKIGMNLIRSKKRRFSHSFTMEDPSDYNCRFVFNFGGSTGSINLDNVEITQTSTAVESKDDQKVSEYSLLGNYPNPFNGETKICFSLAGKSLVTIEVYNLLGELKETLCAGKFDAGQHEISFKSDFLATGVYFYRLEAETPAGTFHDVRKMVLVK